MVATVDSTNRLARRIARVYLESDRPVPPLVLLAREQTEGRGRRGHAWSSPAGQGIYASLLLSVADAETLTALPLSVPLALCQALDELGLSCGIKWPNDLVAGRRKLGGILIEALAARKAVVVGFGLNGSQDEGALPTPEATSLRLVSGVTPDLSRLAVDLATGLFDRLDKSDCLGTIIEAYRGRSVHRPGDRLSVRLGGERVTGRFAGFDEHGRLCLETSDGLRALSSADLLTEEAAHEATDEAVGPGA